MPAEHRRNDFRREAHVLPDTKPAFTRLNGWVDDGLTLADARQRIADLSEMVEQLSAALAADGSRYEAFMNASAALSSLSGSASRPAALPESGADTTEGGSHV